MFPTVRRLLRIGFSSGGLEPGGLEHLGGDLALGSEHGIPFGHEYSKKPSTCKQSCLGLHCPLAFMISHGSIVAQCTKDHKSFRRLAIGQLQLPGRSRERQKGSCGSRQHTAGSAQD